MPEQKLNDPPKDYPIISDALRKTIAQLSPQGSQSGAPLIYRLSNPKRPKTKNAGLITVNGKKKVYVEYDDGSVKIIEDVPPAQVTTKHGGSSPVNKTHSVFHELADFIFDLVGNREDFIIGDDEDDAEPADGKDKGGDDEEEDDDGEGDDEENDTKERMEKSEEIMAPDRDAIELGLHLDGLTDAGRTRWGEMLNDPDDLDYKPFREELTYE